MLNYNVQNYLNEPFNFRFVDKLCNLSKQLMPTLDILLRYYNNSCWKKMHQLVRKLTFTTQIRITVMFSLQSQSCKITKLFQTRQLKSASWNFF